MVPIVDQLRERRLWQVGVAYGLAALAVLAVVWGATSALGLTVLYVRFTAVVALMGLPMVLGLAWALRQPRDPDGRGSVVRE